MKKSTKPGALFNARKAVAMKKKHKRMSSTGNNFMMAPARKGGGVRSPDLGGTGPHEIAKTGLGKEGGFVGDWPYNKFKKKSKKRKGGKKRK